jgi:hypothetical protein
MITDERILQIADEVDLGLLNTDGTLEPYKDDIVAGDMSKPVIAFARQLLAEAAPADYASPSAAPQGETPAATEVFELKPYIYLNEQSGAWRYRDSEFKEGRYIPLYRWNEIAKMLDRAAIPAAPVQQASDVLKGGEQ